MVGSIARGIVKFMAMGSDIDLTQLGVMVFSDRPLIQMKLNDGGDRQQAVNELIRNGAADIQLGK